MATTPEGRVKAAIKKELELRGFWRAGSARPADVKGWFYMPVSNGMGVHGIPDFVCCWEGSFFGIEAKAPGGVLSEKQKSRHEEITAAKGQVITINDVSQLREYLDARHRR